MHRNKVVAALHAVGLCLGLLPGMTFADPPDGYTFRSYDEGLAQSARTHRPVFLYFGREGCGFCDFTNQNAFSDAEVHEKFNTHYELVYVDAESGRRLTLPSGERITERDLGTRFNAFVTPVFVFLAADGSQLLKRIGIQSAEELLLYDQFIHGEHYRTQSFDQFASRND